jgi:hypothetical protein
MAVNYRGKKGPGGGTGPKYVFQLLFSKKITKFANNSATTEARDKINTDLEFLELSCNFN